jgi:hypothetical protein
MNHAGAQGVKATDAKVVLGGHEDAHHIAPFILSRTVAKVVVELGLAT